MPVILAQVLVEPSSFLLVATQVAKRDSPEPGPFDQFSERPWGP